MMLAAFALLAVSCAAQTVAAHPGPRLTTDPSVVADVGADSEVHTAGVGAGALAALLTVSAVLLALARGRSRRWLALAFASLLVLFAHEAGLHSVHHLGSEPPAAPCPVATAAAQLGGLCVDAIALDGPVLDVAGHVVPAAPALVVVRPAHPTTGRAPPA